VVSIKDQVGESAFEDMRALLEKSHPGCAPASDADVDVVFAALAKRPDSSYSHLKVPPPTLPSPKESHKITHYKIDSIHTRVGLAAPYEEFCGDLAMIRFDLPTESDVTVQSFAGRSEPSDRLLPDLPTLQSWCSEQGLDFTPRRAEMVTPPRTGTRFGAVSLYFLYKAADDALPSAYIVEPGYATGAPAVDYLQNTMETHIDHRCEFAGTSFANEDNTYKGYVTMDGAQIKLLHVESWTTDNENYIQVDANFKQVVMTEPTLGVDTLLESMCRVSAIANAIDVETSMKFQDELGAIGMTALDWIEPPKDQSHDS